MRLLFIALISLCSSAFAQLQYLEGISFFPGDRHGDFANDLVAVLSDHSQWKVHPQDRERFSLWGANEPIQVSARTTFYWFKREHKFELVNLTRNQSVRAMLVGYPENMLYIMDSEMNVTGSQIVPYTITDWRGNTHTYHYYRDVYEKKLILSDGSMWTLVKKDDFDFFQNGNAVYVGKNNSGISNFIISGTEREAAFAWVSRD